MKLNVVANDADSANDDGNHFAQQFAWSWNSDIWDAYTQIDCIEHAGQLTLSEELVKPEEQVTTTGEGENTESQPTDPSGQETDSQPNPEESGSETDPAEEPDNKGCRSSVGAGLLFLLPAAAIPMFRRKRNDD